MSTKRFLSWIIVLCCALALFLQPLGLSAANVKINILTVNDFHGALVGEGDVPGAARLAGLMEYIYNNNPNGTIVLSAGDMFQGTVRSNILYGKPVMEMMNVMNFKAMALGNHEFDWGMDHLKERALEAKFPMVAANVIEKETNTYIDFVLPYTIIKVKGVNVGVIGLTTVETAYSTNMNVANKFNFEDYVESIGKVYNEVKKEGADVVVVLGHIGSAQKDGVSTGEAVVLMNALDKTDYKIDALISAHEHNVVKDKINGIPIVQAGNNGRYIGVITLVYSTDEKSVIESSVDVVPVSLKQKEHHRVKKIVEKSAFAAIPFEKTILGKTEGLYHDRHTVSPLGMWAADTMKEAINVDIAVQNGGGLRKSLLAGNITLGNFYDIAPFDNTIITMEMTGKQIKDLMEYGLNNEFGTAQYSGLNIVYNSSASKGAKIVDITLADGRPLLDDGVYTVCTNDFLAGGGDGFVIFKEAKNQVNTNVVLRDVFIDAVKKAENVIFKDDGRFKDKAVVKQEKSAA